MATKKVAKKKVAKKAKMTEGEKKMRAEIRKMEAKQKKDQKLIKEFQKRNEEFGKAVDELAKKYNLKAVLQGYDVKTELPFTMGFNLKNEFEANAMKFSAIKSFEA